MKTLLLRSVLLLLVWGELALGRAAEPVNAKLRNTIMNSLGFLAREGDVWMADKNCNGCHHMPVLIWGQREAKARGFPVDQKKFDEWLSWSDARATDKKPGLEEAAFMILSMPKMPAPELAKLILSEQKPDGSWAPAGQFASMQQRATPEAQANSIRLFLLALATSTDSRKAADEARMKALPFLSREEVSTSVETLFYKALFARRFGQDGEADVLRGQILKLQHGDGGWGWRMAEAQSDALATGEVLYLLNQSSDTASKEAADRAAKWLISTQRDDGSWLIDITRISKIDRSKPDKAKSLKAATEIYHYWGTAWATIGLLQGIPEQAK